MKQTIDYSGLTGKEKEDKAIEDCKFYFGEQFETITESLKQVKVKKYGLYLLEFAGVVGYPAHALLNKYATNIETEE